MLTPAKPRMLASVNCITEARLASKLGADIIDLKDPHNGALGALSADLIQQIVQTLDASTVTSATIGDDNSDPGLVTAAVEKIASTGVNYVKVGVDSEKDFDLLLDALRPLAATINIVLVLFADRPFANNALSISTMPATAAKAGIQGIMLDTALKRKASLRAHQSPQQLRSFITNAQQHGLLCGLAGSLSVDDILPLAELQPDYLGFRGALCSAHHRTRAISTDAFHNVRKQIDFAQHQHQTVMEN